MLPPPVRNGIRNDAGDRCGQVRASKRCARPRLIPLPNS